MEECNWQTVVLTPKGNNNYQGIGIVEVLLKTVTGILNCRIMAAIQLQDTLHRFREDRGTKKTSIEAKLLQQLMAMREEVLYEIFLDLHKIL